MKNLSKKGHVLTIPPKKSQNVQKELPGTWIPDGWSFIRYMSRYLEPNWTPFLKVNPPQNKAEIPIKTRGPIWVPGQKNRSSYGSKMGISTSFSKGDDSPIHFF